jgi:hypothetical protein
MVLWARRRIGDSGAVTLLVQMAASGIAGSAVVVEQTSGALVRWDNYRIGEEERRLLGLGETAFERAQVPTRREQAVKRTTVVAELVVVDIGKAMKRTSAEAAAERNIGLADMSPRREPVQRHMSAVPAQYTSAAVVEEIDTAVVAVGTEGLQTSDTRIAVGRESD